MNSKLIAIIAVVAMCGAALVGVGYAYTATYNSGSNTITSSVDYVTLEPNGSTGGVVTITPVVDYNYDANAVEKKYSINGVTDGTKAITLDMTKSAGSTGPYTLTATFTINENAINTPVGTKLVVKYNDGQARTVDVVKDMSAISVTLDTLPNNFTFTYEIVKYGETSFESVDGDNKVCTFSVSYALSATA